MSDPFKSAKYLSASGVLNDFSNEMYQNTMGLNEPIISGRNVLRTIRQSHKSKKLDEIIFIDSKVQERIIDVLTDLVSMELDSNIEKFKKKIREKISEVSGIGKNIKLGRTYFDNLTPPQQQKVISLSVRKIIGNIYPMRTHISSMLLEENAKIEELMCLDQALFLIEENLKPYLHTMNPKKLSRDLFFCLMLTLKLEAYKRDKIRLDEIKKMISEENLLSIKTKPDAEYIKKSEYKPILELLKE